MLRPDLPVSPPNKCYTLFKIGFKKAGPQKKKKSDPAFK